VVDGGPTLNPSINEILTGIDATPGEEVIVLPNSPNVLMAAEEAARLAGRPVRVVASTSQQAGLAAVVGGFDPNGPAEENATRLEEELRSITTGLVAEADRDDAEGRYRRGDAVGFVGSDLVAWGDPAATLGELVGRLSADAEVVTVFEGRDPPVGARDLELPANGAELEVETGGQPTYWWLLAAQ
jgi:dihydroxyacetone kinase-like predicted kinase